jgi:hypothetical protein
VARGFAFFEFRIHGTSNNWSLIALRTSAAETGATSREKDVGKELPKTQTEVQRRDPVRQKRDRAAGEGFCQQFCQQLVRVSSVSTVAMSLAACPKGLETGRN